MIDDAVPVRVLHNHNEVVIVERLVPGEFAVGDQVCADFAGRWMFFKVRKVHPRSVTIGRGEFQERWELRHHDLWKVVLRRPVEALVTNN